MLPNDQDAGSPTSNGSAATADGDPLPPPGSADQAPTPSQPSPMGGGWGGATPRRRRRLGSATSVVAVSILSATLASAGTFAVALNLTGSAGTSAGPSATPNADAASTATKVETVDLVDIVAAAKPTVVTITADGVASGGPFNVPTTGVGSGIIVTTDGYILTNRHVVANANTLTVTLEDGREFDASVVRIADDNDLALIKVEATGLTAATIGNSGALEVGQTAIAIGSPLGTYTETVTQGIVSGLNRDITVTDELTGRPTALHDLIQTDAAINPGNSGGPLLDAAGQVIGINTAVERDSTGIGFAIPIDIARPIMAQALAGEQLARPYVGIRYLQIDLKVKNEKHLSVDHGALIEPTTDAAGATLPAITPGSPAEAAGLRAEDIVLAIEGQVVDAEHPLDALLTSYRPGQAVKLTILRGTSEIEISVTLGTRPEDL